MKRIPIMVRTPIIANAEVWHIVHGHKQDFSDGKIVATFTGDISVPRYYYHRVMQQYKQEHPGDMGCWCICKGRSDVNGND